jgi:LPXTG-site transpeptidase (sortase) family protein
MDAPIVPISTTGDALIPPSDPQLLGWWSAGARTGARWGSALVTGHTVHTGGGAMDNLERLHRGDRVTVYTGRGIIPYDVRSVEVFGKGSVARHAERLFSQEVRGRLVLITCEDWDGTRYLSNVVVVATPTRA